MWVTWHVNGIAVISFDWRGCTRSPTFQLLDDEFDEFDVPADIREARLGC